MSKINFIILLIFSFSAYKTYEFFTESNNSSLEIHSEESLSKQKKPKTNTLKKENKKISKETKNKYIMEDKRINVIAPDNKKENKIFKKDNFNSITKKIRNQIPKNLERVLKYELNVWSRGLRDEELNILKSLWSRYESNDSFSQEDLDDINLLNKRNILNAIRASKPSLIKEESSKNYQDERITEPEDNYYQDDYREERDDIYREEEPVDKSYLNNEIAEPEDNYYQDDYREERDDTYREEEPLNNDYIKTEDDSGYIEEPLDEQY